MKKGMKRVASILMMCALMAVLGACGAGKEETATCKIEQEGVAVEVKIDAVNDIISKWTQTSIIPIGDMSEDDKALIDAVIDQMTETYSAYSAVNYDAQLKDGSFVEVITIDMTNKDDVQGLVDENLLPVQGNASRLSLKQTVNNLKASGWTVEQ